MSLKLVLQNAQKKNTIWIGCSIHFFLQCKESGQHFLTLTVKCTRHYYTTFFVFIISDVLVFIEKDPGQIYSKKPNQLQVMSILEHERMNKYK